jgi:hypothetical protein
LMTVLGSLVGGLRAAGGNGSGSRGQALFGGQVIRVHSDARRREEVLRGLLWHLESEHRESTSSSCRGLGSERAGGLRIEGEGGLGFEVRRAGGPREVAASGWKVRAVFGSAGPEVSLKRARRVRGSRREGLTGSRVGRARASGVCGVRGRDATSFGLAGFELEGQRGRSSLGSGGAGGSRAGRLRLRESMVLV